MWRNSFAEVFKPSIYLHKVITYDLLPKPEQMIPFENLIPNCEFKQMNVFDESEDTTCQMKKIQTILVLLNKWLS